VLIQRHIASISLLTSPYKILAADVDSSNSVGISDLLPLRDFILGNTSSLPHLWRFVTSDYVFPGPPYTPFSNPFTTEYVYPANTVTLGLINQDFIGMKVGDVNNDWDESNARLARVGDVVFEAEDRTVKPATQIEVPVLVSQFRDLLGYQFTLEWNGAVLQFDQVENRSLNAQYGEWDVANGRLTTSWSDFFAQTLNDGDTAFVLHFTVLGQIGDRSSLAITSSFTPAEAYNGELEYLNVISPDATITVGDEVVTGNLGAVSGKGYRLDQNVPNPFQGRTQIRFALPVSEEVTFRIYNAAGQEVKIISGQYGVGEHTIEWDGSGRYGQPLSSGHYFCRMETPNFTGSIKLILTD
jgi:hypothetical protein